MVYDVLDVLTRQTPEIVILALVSYLVYHVG